MDIKEIKVKSCLNKSKIAGYTINPYTGCMHNCVYCYATFIKRFQNIKADWGDFCYAKINCPELLEKELKKAKSGNIWLSSVTDCYQPIEREYKLTRKILEILSKPGYKDNFTIEILTKSALVRRDFDLLKKLNVKLGMTINTLDAEKSRIIEPLASPPKERIQALREAKEQGIKVYAFISPILPGITDLEALFKELNFCDYCFIELLNTKYSVMQRLIPLIKEKLPSLLKEYEDLDKNYSSYVKNTEKQARQLEKKYGLKIKEIIVHQEKYNK